MRGGLNMKISRVQINNYRNLRHIDIEMGNLMTIVGDNNSGKTNFLRALSIPLSSDDNSYSKSLSWYDINNDAKKEYYNFLQTKKQSIINGKLSVDDLVAVVPEVKIKLFITPGDEEHYDVNDILINEGKWMGGILYRYYIKNPETLLKTIKAILSTENNDDDVQMSLLPMELYDYSVTVPGKGNKVSYDTLSKFRSVVIPAERDGFASNADRLGSKALSDLLKMRMTAESQARLEVAYKNFFDTVKKESELDKILNWQDYTDIKNAQDFFHKISVLPNMPQMSSIFGSVRLGYEEGNLSMQGLGYRNIILMTVLLNSYINKEQNVSFRLMTVEEPEAHLCISNILLLASLLNNFSQRNSYTQIVYSTHNAELINKIGLDKVIVMHNGEAIDLNEGLDYDERDYIAVHTNTDIMKLLYSKKLILVEGITEELLIKSYLQVQRDLNDVKVLSFHKGYTKIIDIWKKVNGASHNRLGIVRDFDNQPNARSEHEKRQSKNIIIRTTKGYTLETDIVHENYTLLQEKYGDEYGWSQMNEEKLQAEWRNKKSGIMLRICHDIVNGELDGFIMPPHIKDILDFMRENNYED